VCVCVYLARFNLPHYTFYIIVQKILTSNSRKVLQDETDSGFMKPGARLSHKCDKYGRALRMTNAKLCDQSVSGDLNR
jgi:hypothetical protein